MKIRVGYVSTALSLYECSPSKTITYTRYKDLPPEEQKQKLTELIQTNIYNTYRTIAYNIGQEIHIYRGSSSIVPLATHKDVDFDYIQPFEKEWAALGELITKHKLRFSFHPNQFTLFTSPKKDITLNAVRDLEYHYNMLEAMNIEHKTINIHIGGAYGDKETTLQRFRKNVEHIPDHIRGALTFENDDKTYTTLETVQACEDLGFRCVFDYHHHMANPSEFSLERVFKTWEGFGEVPKIHVSSPKSEKEFRSHADFVDVEFIKPLLQQLKTIGQDCDFMIEAKQKDRACLRFVEEASKLKFVKRIGGATLEM